MFIKEILPVKTLGAPQFTETKIAVWDTIIHAPVVTHSFIKTYTGLDIANEFPDLGNKAEARRILLAKTLKSIILYKIPKEHDKMIFEYILSHNIGMQQDFALTCAYMADSDDVSQFLELLSEHGIEKGIAQEDIMKALEIPSIKMSIHEYSFVKHNWKFTIDQTEYRVGY